MFADDESPQRQFDERLDRESGVFVESDTKEVGCDSDEQPCAPDDYANDPEPRETGIPGTVDDAPLDFGLEIPAPADQHVVFFPSQKEGTITIVTIGGRNGGWSPEWRPGLVKSGFMKS